MLHRHAVLHSPSTSIPGHCVKADDVPSSAERARDQNQLMQALKPPSDSACKRGTDFTSAAIHDSRPGLSLHPAEDQADGPTIISLPPGESRRKATRISSDILQIICLTSHQSPTNPTYYTHGSTETRLPHAHVKLSPPLLEQDDHPRSSVPRDHFQRARGAESGRRGPAKPHEPAVRRARGNGE